MTVNIFIKIIFAYSPIKKRANGAPANSTLYPETSSDSPSVRSKGARFVSARVEINHIIHNGKKGKKNQLNELHILKVFSFQEPKKKTRGIIIKLKLTS